MGKNSITNKLEEVWKFIDGTLSDPKELEAATAAGFPNKELEERLKQYDQIVEKRQLHDTATGRRKSATTAVEVAVDTLWDHYIDIVNLARNMFEEDVEVYNLLDLKGDRERGYGEMKYQVHRFYSTILKNKAILDAFVKMKISKEYIEMGLKLYSDMVELKKFQSSAESLRSEDHDEFEDSFQELEAWYKKANRLIKSWKKLAAKMPAVPAK
ncbi:hypothetical protein R9C00_17005 [Flammeovirgaceae bacterium SG7u.111]|nr:hypothetical protein [Flammeovirgaceae bacterium SG7u.132]WPO33400.1 hypothetical protein R9C00_17005 [Flammeovirgaceae bacterium SG7u.111]